MPLLLSRELDNGLRLGVWQIREPEPWFLQQVHMNAEESQELSLLRSRDKREQRLAYRMVLSALLKPARFSISYDEHRKPYLHGYPGHISVSHSCEMAAAIYHPLQPVGIDIEKVSPRLLPLTDKFVALSECLEISGDRSDEVLTLLWSAKEALYKMDGKRGLHFNRDLIVQGLAARAQGKLRGQVMRGIHTGEHPLAWEKLGDYVMVHNL